MPKTIIKRKAGRPKKERQGLTYAEFAKRDGCSANYVSQMVIAGVLISFEDGSLDPALVGTPWRARNRSRNTVEPAGPSGAPIDESGGETPNLDTNQIKGLNRSEAERYKLIYNILSQKVDFEVKLREVARVEEMMRLTQIAYAKVRSRLSQISAELAPNLVMIQTAGEAQQIIQLAVCKALADVSEAAAKEAKRLREMRDAAQG